jgi:hypothetical protein
VVVLAGIGPIGTGMKETYQVTGALKQLPFGNRIVLLTDGRFSGASTGACIGHIGPEGLAGGPIGKHRHPRGRPGRLGEAPATQLGSERWAQKGIDNSFFRHFKDEEENGGCRQP